MLSCLAALTEASKVVVITGADVTTEAVISNRDRLPPVVHTAAAAFLAAAALLAPATLAPALETLRGCR